MFENVSYAETSGSGGLRQIDVSIFATGGFQRRQLAEDCDAGGLHVRGHAELEQLVEMQRLGGWGRLGEVVAIECPEVDGALLTALAHLDIHAARAGKRVVVATAMDHLDAVFGCLDQSEAHIMVRPTRVDRIMLFTRLQAALGVSALREMSQDERLTLMRLTEQVERLARTMGDWPAADLPERAVPRQGAPAAPGANGGSLPDPRTVRATLRQRQKRAALFGADLFADPAWDMLLDLTAATAEGGRVSVTSLCIASGVPATTALRWIGQMVDAGLFARAKDPDDARRAFITLTPRSMDAMAAYFGGLAPVEALAA